MFTYSVRDRNETMPSPAYGSNSAAASQAYSFPGATTQAPYRDYSNAGGGGNSGGSLGDEAMPPSPPSPHAASHPSSSNFKVVIRARPPLHRELNGERPFVNVVSVVSSLIPPPAKTNHRMKLVASTSHIHSLLQLNTRSVCGRIKPSRLL